ncbi:MAG: acyl-CoA dehydrogenase family protein, partial [Candidatus Eiseniibacteriota bacterium]
MSVTAKVRPGAVAPVATHEELVGRARELAPMFFERAMEAEKLRRMPDANVAALRKAGLFKVVQARRYGGYQMPFTTHIDVVAEIARGCPSTAWCLGVTHAHSWFMGLFPEQAQEDTYGTDPDAIISAVIAPRGKAVMVDGGYRLNGFWPFGSGCEHSQWLFLGAVVVDESGKEVDAADFLVPTADVTLKDDWNVVALRGTGSCSIVAKDVFVPKHRMLSLPGSIAGKHPGAAHHEGWLYRSAVVPVLTLALAPSALGMAEAALDQLKTRLPGRIVAYTEGEVQIEQPITHVQVAEAATKIRVARLMLHASASDI